MATEKFNEEKTIKIINEFYRGADNGKPEKLIACSAVVAAMLMKNGENVLDILSEIRQYSTKQLKSGRDMISSLKPTMTINGYEEVADKAIAILDDLTTQASRKEATA